MRMSASIVCAIGICASGAAALAQSVAPLPADRNTLDDLKRAITGAYTSVADPNQPKLELHVTPIVVEGLADTLLVQIAREDARFEPFRMYLMQLYGRKDVLRLRTFELPAAPGMREAFAGLWATPGTLALLDVAALAPSLDMPVTKKAVPGRGEPLHGQTEHPFPVNRNGAIEMTAGFTFLMPRLTLQDAGFDAAGKEVWSTETSFVNRMQDTPVRREESGLVSITTVPPPAGAAKLESGGEIAIHFTYWTSTGLKIDTSRKPGREPTKIRIPGGTPFPALDTALAAIAKGERRKIVVPASLAYGASGRGTVPPNATLIYDIECLDVNNSGQSAPAPSPHSVPTPRGPSPHGAPAPAAAPPRGDEPIGSPPTNGTPESPR